MLRKNLIFKYKQFIYTKLQPQHDIIPKISFKQLH